MRDFAIGILLTSGIWSVFMVSVIAKETRRIEALNRYIGQLEHRIKVGKFEGAAR